MPKVKIKLPNEIKNAPLAVRKELIATLEKALGIPKKLYASGEKLWSKNTDPLLAEAEEEFFEWLFNEELESLARLFDALELPYEVEKSFGSKYEYDLVKSRWGNILQKFTKKAKEVLSFVKQNGKAWTKEQLQKLDNLLQNQLNNPDSKVAQYMARMGILAKLRNELDRQGYQAQNAEFENMPKTIEEATEQETKVHVTATLPEGNMVTITVDVPPLTPDEATVLKHAEVHCASKIKEISEKHREQVKQAIIRATKEHWTPSQLAQYLFDTMPDKARDWRRVAITELSMAHNDAYLLGCIEGEKIIVNSVSGCCSECAELIDGKTFIVTKKPRWDDPFTYVWPGKTNYGRKVSDYVPCIPLHPNCRHRYHRVPIWIRLDQ